jgi:hypothetical protein
MQTDPTPLDERLQRMVNLKVPGIDIMHGELKMRMLEAEAEQCYTLTYDISFAIGARNED